MTDEQAKAVRALQNLGRRVQHGLTKLEPVSEPHLAKVRAAVRQQWEARQHTQAQSKPSQAVSPAKPTQPQAQNKSKSKDRSQDHGHSH